MSILNSTLHPFYATPLNDLFPFMKGFSMNILSLLISALGQGMIWHMAGNIS